MSLSRVTSFRSACQNHESIIFKGLNSLNIYFDVLLPISSPSWPSDSHLLAFRQSLLAIDLPKVLSLLRSTAFSLTDGPKF